MNNDTQTENNQTDTDIEATQQPPDPQHYDAWIQRKIDDTRQAITGNPQIAQSEDGQRLLQALQNPKSDMYKEAVNEIRKEAIQELEQAQHLSPVEIEWLAILKNPPATATDPGTPLQTADIPHAIMLDTVEKIALGWTRIEVAKQLMQQETLPDWLQPLAEMDTTEAANLLSQRLRAADPFNSKFSHSKYQQHAEAVIHNAQQALKDRIHLLIDAQIKAFEQTEADYAQLIENAKKEIDQTEDATQRRQSVKLWMSLNKQKEERAQVFLTQFQQILAAN